MEKTINDLNNGLKDQSYRMAWVANIAMAQIDAERWYRHKNKKVGKYLNYQDRLKIANDGAEYFLQILSMK
mgnify:FL=1